MAGVLEAIASLLVAAGVGTVLLAGLLGDLPGWRCWRWLGSRLRPGPAPLPPRRTLEQVAGDARRVSRQFHREGMRHAQYEGRRQAFDRVLGEAADLLEVPHLLDLLPPGAERDHERERLEQRLAEWGVLDRPAA